jgi:hypothetical protein
MCVTAWEEAGCARRKRAFSNRRKDPVQARFAEIVLDHRAQTAVARFTWARSANSPIVRRSIVRSLVTFAV